jgi:putative drug exporter of the RND superfamily
MTDSARTDAAAQPGARPRLGEPRATYQPGEPGTVRRSGDPAAPGHRDDHVMLSRLGRFGRWCARHAWLVVAVWVVVLAGVTFGHRALGGSYTDNFSLPNSPSQAGAALLQQHEPQAGGLSGQLVFTVGSGSLAGHRSAIETSVANVKALPHVLSAGDPLSSGTTAKDGRTAYDVVNFGENPATLGSGYITRVDEAVTPARAAGVSVSYGGTLGQAARPPAQDSRSELIGILVAIVVLLLGFGSVLAAGLPILTAVLGMATALGVLGMAAAAVSFPSVSPTLAVMMGLGVGIDYALFLTTRHRQQVIDGADPAEAAGRTVSTSGRAVLIAAVTVIIAMLGLYASGIGFLGTLGVAAAIGVAVGAVSALTLVPALLGLAGRRIDRLRVRRPAAEASAAQAGWARYAAAVGAHPWRFLLAGVMFLGVLAIPVLSLQLGHVDAGADPASYTDKQAYDAISSAFGPGASGTFTVVIQPGHGPGSAQGQQLAGTVQADLAAAPGVAAVSPVQASPDGAILVTTVVPSSRPQDAATSTLLTTLRDTTLPGALSGTGARGYVTGITAEQLDFRDQVGGQLPVVIAVVIAAAFLLLLATFRSPVLALKAAAANLLSIGASYGVLVAVFQWGWGSSALGVSEKIPIESYVPMMMFAIVFGLSMDYEVFLLSRIREAWTAILDNHASVASGLASTARVITCAALIMASVFLSFLLSTNVVVKMLALGLGVSVLIDATVIRLIVVPATMFLLGRYNWWIPAWLDRALPHLEPEGPPSRS